MDALFLSPDMQTFHDHRIRRLRDVNIGTLLLNLTACTGHKLLNRGREQEDYEVSLQRTVKIVA